MKLRLILASMLALSAFADATDTYTFTSSGTSVQGQPVTVTGTVTLSSPVVVTPPPPPPPPPPVTSNCGMQLGSLVIFCDTFDAPAGVGNGNRAGQLNGNVWGASRALGQGVNLGQNQFGMWNSTLIQNCNGTSLTVTPPNDIIICNGQLREAVNDNNSLVFDSGDVASLAVYPKQPFDFAGRTGTVSFDVSNDSTGNHAAWPEFWMSDLPIPDPFSHFNSWEAMPANGLGLRFSAVAPPGMQGTCRNQNNLSSYRWTLESAVVSRAYVDSDTNGYGPAGTTVTVLDCVIASTGVGNMNHVEIRISQNQIDVYATDAGVAASPTTLRHIAVVNNANLTFTRGLIWLEDVHYNADKETLSLGTAASTSQRQHTFSWDNVAFDGPFTDRDFTFDAPDALTPAVHGAVNLGKKSTAAASTTWTITGLPVNPQAAGAKVLFDFNTGANPNPTVLKLVVNGNATTVPWPYPDNTVLAWRTFAITIPLSQLVAGTNTVQLGADVSVVFANVDIVLANVTGGVPVLPGNSTAYPQ